MITPPGTSKFRLRMISRYVTYPGLSASMKIKSNCFPESVGSVSAAGPSISVIGGYPGPLFRWKPERAKSELGPGRSRVVTLLERGSY